MPDRSAGNRISWFTFRVRGREDEPVGTRRRALLAGGLAGTAAALAGCWKSSSGGGSGAKGRSHPLAGMLTGTLALVARYDATIAAQPALAARLAPLRAEHWTHATALGAAMGQAVPSGAASPSGAAAPTDARTVLATLRAVETAAQRDAVSACLASAPGYAALLGSIAACRATHVEALQ